MDIQQAETEEVSVILRTDFLRLVNWNQLKTERNEDDYIEINHVVGQLLSNKMITQEAIKEDEFQFMLDLKSVNSKTSIDSEL